MGRGGAMALLAVTLAVSPAAAQTPDETALRSAETALAAAMSARDAETMRRMVADDFVTADAVPLERAAWIDTLLPLCGGGRVSTGDLQVAVRGTAALVSYVATISRDDPCQPAEIRMRVAHAWSLTDGAWRLSLRNAQPLDDAAAPAAAAASLQPPPAPPPAPRPLPREWAGSMELTVLSTRGNVNTFTFGTTGELAWQQGPWRTDVRGGFLRTTADSAENRHSVNVQLRQSRTVSGVVELFGRVLYQRDLFAGILRRFGTDAGIGLLIVRDGQRLQATLGVGSTEEARVNAPVQSAPVTAVGLQYRYNLSQTTAITEEAQLTSSLVDAANWRFDSTLALTTVLRQPLQLRTSYQAKYSNQPVPGFKRLDGIIAAALVARF